jgi:putative hydrolase of the HAD superfamily
MNCEACLYINPEMKYLIWDFSGTMGYRRGGSWSAVLQEILAREMPGFEVETDRIGAFLQEGFPWHQPEKPHPELSTSEAWWDSLDPIFTRAFMAGTGLDQLTAHRLAKMVRQVCPERSAWKLYDDTIKVLALLSKEGWIHITLTNHIPELPAIFNYLGLSSHFAALFNSAQTGYEKPHPQAFRQVLAWAAKPEALWMIGDNYAVDIIGAEAQGIPGILVRKTDPRADCCCADLSGIVQIVS